MGPLLADPQFHKYGDQFPKTLGFTGIAWRCSAATTPSGIAAAALVWAAIERATQPLSTLGIPQEIGVILQGSFLLAAVIVYEVVRRRNERASAKEAADRAARPREPPGGPPGRAARSARRPRGTAVAVEPSSSRGATCASGRPRWCCSPSLGLAGACRRPRHRRRRPTSPRPARSASPCGTAMPIALAGLGGLYAERSGTVNIGLEGMMIIGTIFAGWWGWHWGPWMAIVGGIVGGVLGGLLHALATVTFGVNHIVSGVAINIIAPGVARFMAERALHRTARRQRSSNSPGNTADRPQFTMPFLAAATCSDGRHPTSSAGSRTRGGS